MSVLENFMVNSWRVSEKVDLIFKIIRKRQGKIKSPR